MAVDEKDVVVFIPVALNINFRGARKPFSKTPRGRFLTPRRVARVPTTPAATNHVKTCNTHGVLPVTELTYLQVAKRGTHAVALRHDGAKKHSTRKPKKTIAQTRREAVAPKPAALRDSFICCVRTFYSRRRPDKTPARVACV